MPKSERRDAKRKTRTASRGQQAARSRGEESARAPQLSRDKITAAALEAADRGELEALTMRGLADELGVTAMALYTHVENKDDILDEIIDRVLARDALPLPPHATDWQSWTLEAAQHLRAVLTAYPALLDRYRRRPVGVPAALRRMETALEVLRRAGFTDDQCVRAYAAIHTYTLGFAALEIARETSAQREPRRAAGGLTEASRHYWPAFFASLTADEFPNLARLQPDLVEFTADAQFRHGLLALLSGLEARQSENGERSLR